MPSKFISRCLKKLLNYCPLVSGSEGIHNFLIVMLWEMDGPHFPIIGGSGVLGGTAEISLFRIPPGEWDVVRGFICLELHFSGSKVSCRLIQSWKRSSCGFSKARSRAGVQSVLSMMELGPAEHQASKSIVLCGVHMAMQRQRNAAPAAGVPP